MADKRKSGSSKANDAGSSVGHAEAAVGAGGTLTKRARQDEGETTSSSSSLIISSNAASGGVIRSVKRTSSLQAPIVSLNGAHSAELLDVKFSPDGQLIAAASADRTISVWHSFGGNENIGILRGHAKAVTSIAWSTSAPRTEPRLFSSSADGTLIVWDVMSGSKVRRLRAHKAIVNCVACARGGREILVSGGDDGKVILWDANGRDPLDVLDVGYPVTAVCFSDDGGQIFVGGLDNEIHVYDLLRKEILFSLHGHTDTLSSLLLSPSGTLLLSTAMDDTVRIWDVQPFAPEPLPGQTTDARLRKTLTGAPSGYENFLIKASWSHDERKVASGAADRSCTIWNIDDGTILYKLPGHRGTCTAVSLHPKEPVIVSCSVDSTMLLGEIEP